MRAVQGLAGAAAGFVLMGAGVLWAQGEPGGGASPAAAAPAGGEAGGGGGGSEEQGPPKNLKVLPKDMSRKEVNALMKEFNKALGVKCKFCHNTKDFAADTNKHKDISRQMMKMTQDLAKNHFAYDKAPKMAFNCYVCHQGHDEPKLAP